MPDLYNELMIALHRVWHRRWLALGIAWAVCALGWLAVALIPNRYESRARVYVATQSVIQDKAGISPIEQQKNLDALRQTLVSAANLEQIVRTTDLAKTVATDRDVGDRMAMLRRNIAILSSPDNLFEITTAMADRSLSDRANAVLAAQVTQKLIEIFRQDSVVGDRDETEAGIAFLDRQIAQRGKALAEVEQRRAAFEAEHGGMLPGVGSIGDRIAAARLEMSQLDTQLMGAESALAAMNGQLAGTPSTIAAAGGGPSALGQAQAELAQARANGWTDRHPDVVALQRRIAALKGSGGGASGGSVPNPAWLSIKSMQAERAATVQALRSRKAQIQGDIDAVTARQIAAPGELSEQERLEQDYDAIKAQYDKLLADREEIRMRGSVQSGNAGTAFRVVDPPGVPNAPASPNRPLLLVAVLVVGIGVGVGAAFALEQLRRTAPTAALLAKTTRLPVIGSISEMVTADAAEERRRKLRLFASGCAGLAGACVLLIVVEFVQRGLA